MNSSTHKEQVNIIRKNTVTLTPESSLLEKLARNNPLKIKLGADPTAPDLHLGHAVVLNKMKDLQDMGHEIIFLIGNFTAQIGDPTGKSKTRPPLSDEQIQKNSQTYFEQVFKILDKNKTKIVFNADWLAKLSFSDVIKMCAKTTLMQLVEREDFKNRMNQNIPIGFHELLYPILQAYDSVELKADIEIGGTDQTFNLMFGRHLQEQYGQEGQVVITLPILEGLDGKNKMSKSLGNYVGLKDAPQDAFGKLMSLPDENVANYAKLLLEYSAEEIIELSKLHPMDAKKTVASNILKKYWSEEAALIGQSHFESIFQKRDFSNAINFELKLESNQTSVFIGELVKQVCQLKSSSEAKRLIESGAVFIDDKKITDFKTEISINEGFIFRCGKKIVKINS